MVIECCSQERSYSTFYGLIGERFSKINRVWTDCCETAFANYYSTIHRYETNRLRNIARFFGHLLATDSISWMVFECVKMNEEDTTSSSRIFIKILMSEMMESMGLKTLAERFQDPEVKIGTAGMFPLDVPKNTRFAINYFTSIGLGIITEDMREYLKVRICALSLNGLINLEQNAPKIIMEQRRAMLEAESSSSDSDSSSSDSDSSDTSSESSSSASYDSRKRSRRSPPRRRSFSREDSRTPPRRARHSRSPSPRYERREERHRVDRRPPRSLSRSLSRSPPRRDRRQQHGPPAGNDRREHEKDYDSRGRRDYDRREERSSRHDYDKRRD